MKASFTLDNPDSMSATVTIQMTVAEWVKISNALDAGKHPEWKLRAIINDVVNAARKSFYSSHEIEP